MVHNKKNGYIWLISFATYFIQNDEEVPVSKLGDAVPNPAGNSTKITVDVVDADAQHAKLIVQNMLGQTVFTQKLRGGSNSLQVILSNMPAGLYNYSLVCRGKVIKAKRFLHSN